MCGDIHLPVHASTGEASRLSHRVDAEYPCRRLRFGIIKRTFEGADACQDVDSSAKYVWNVGTSDADATTTAMTAASQYNPIWPVSRRSITQPQRDGQGLLRHNVDELADIGILDNARRVLRLAGFAEDSTFEWKISRADIHVNAVTGGIGELAPV